MLDSQCGGAEVRTVITITVGACLERESDERLSGLMRLKKRGVVLLPHREWPWYESPGPMSVVPNNAHGKRQAHCKGDR